MFTSFFTISPVFAFINPELFVTFAVGLKSTEFEVLIEIRAYFNFINVVG